MESLKKVSITGSHGFIGGALTKRLTKMGVKVYSTIRPDVDVVFLFGSPSSNILFDENIDKCFEDTISSFLNAIQFCRDHKIKLIYPSSATVYNKNTTYAHCKAALEEIHQAYGGNVLGLRIFAGYGPNEGHKGRYASIVYQFCKQMKAGEQPTIFGDGTQSRDFVYIEDIIDVILDSLDKTGFIDIGTGINTDFNTIVDYINATLGTVITPIYIPKPQTYIQETVCSHPPEKLWTPFRTSITNILENL